MTTETDDLVKLVGMLRRNPRGGMFELEHQCADTIERLQADLRECVELLEWAGEQLVLIGLEGGSLCQKISKTVSRLKEKP